MRFAEGNKHIDNDGVILIRYFDRWMDLYGLLAVRSAWARGFIFLSIFLIRFGSLLDRFWDGFWDPKFVPKSIFLVFFWECFFLPFFYRFFIDFWSDFKTFFTCVFDVFIFCEFCKNINFASRFTVFH